MIIIKSFRSNFDLFSTSNTDAGNILRILELEISIISNELELLAHPVGVMELATSIFSVVHHAQPFKINLGRDKQIFSIEIDEKKEIIIARDYFDENRYIELKLGNFITQFLNSLDKLTDYLRESGQIEEEFFLKTMFSLF